MPVLKIVKLFHYLPGRFLSEVTCCFILGLYMNFDKCLVKCKGKVIQLQADVTQRVGRGLALLFHDRGTRRG